MADLIALVVATLERKQLSAIVVTGTEYLIDDIRENYTSREAGDSIGDPPGPGPWIWEGTIVSSRSHEGDYEEEYKGAYRKLTPEEEQKLLRGEFFIEWPPLDDDHE